jgi:hypothetical protein
MGWLREAISDENNLADIAYIMVGVSGIAAISISVFLCVMSLIDYVHCTPTLTISTGETDARHIVPCRYDPLPMGQAIGLVFTAYAALLGSLAGYMAATRRRAKATE